MRFSCPIRAVADGFGHHVILDDRAVLDAGREQQTAFALPRPASGLLDGQRRLFAEHALAGLQRASRHRDVPVIRRGNKPRRRDRTREHRAKVARRDTLRVSVVLIDGATGNLQPRFRYVAHDPRHAVVQLQERHQIYGQTVRSDPDRTRARRFDGAF